MTDINVFAETDYRNKRRRFGISREDRRLHMYVVGRTGMGKTSLLQNMIMNDVYAGEGLCFLDPHGDAVSQLLDYIPEERLKDVIYFDPGDFSYPIPLNVLDRAGIDQKHLLVSGVLSIFRKLFDHYFQHRQEHILRNCLLALLEQEMPVTLYDVYRLLVSWRYRQPVVANIRDPVVWSFWMYEFSKLALYSRSDALPAILNKLGAFLTIPLVRNIVGQPKNTFDIREVMDEGKILLVNLSKGRLGEDVASFLGSLIVLQLQLAALSRINTVPDRRRDFYLYIDEFQSFLIPEAFEGILSESRKYRLCLVLSHQYVDQLDERLQKAVFGNVGTMIAFPVGIDDTGVLTKYFEPEFSPSDLVGNDRYHMYLRLAVNGKMTTPFSASSLPPLDQFVRTGRRDEVIARSRAEYSRPAVTATGP